MTTQDSYFLDIENYCLTLILALEEGPARVDNPEWRRALITANLEPWISYGTYAQWVRDGGGDEWFCRGE